MKKITLLFLALIISVVTLSSCSNEKEKYEPINLANFLDEKGYRVKITIDDDDINAFADELEIRSKGISCIVAAAPKSDGYYNSDKAGYYIFCDNNDTANKMMKDLEKFIDDNEDFKEEVKRGIVDKSGKLVFIGCEDAWEDIQ